MLLRARLLARVFAWYHGIMVSRKKSKKAKRSHREERAKLKSVRPMGRLARPGHESVARQALIYAVFG